jgi:hypothetical protein
MKTRSTLLIALLALAGCSEEFPEPALVLEVDATVDLAIVPDMRPDAVVDAEPDVAVDMCHAEICNGVDDDCDGQIDEGFGLGEACAEGLGVCRAMGEAVCDDAGGTICSADPGSPSEEICDGLDNDCDGQPDDDLGIGEPCQDVLPLDATCTTEGVWVCDPERASEPLYCNAAPVDPDGDGVGCEADCAPNDPAIPMAAEICNLLDDTCSGVADDGIECDCIEIAQPSHRYLACPDVRTWQQGVDLCAQYRSRIVVFENSNEEFWLLATTFLVTGAISQWWIGLRQDANDVYRWVDDSLPYDGWPIGQPAFNNEQPCVYTLGISGTWNDTNCLDRHGVICEDLCEGGDVDGDGDGVGRCSGDCDDTESQVKPGAVEQCGNDRDDNCNGEIDEDCD